MSYDFTTLSQPTLGLPVPDQNTLPIPAAPIARGPDMRLFQRYADYRSAQKDFFRCTDNVDAAAGDMSMLTKAEAVARRRFDTARLLFLGTPALTDTGVQLKLEFAMEDTETAHVGFFDEATAIFSAIQDLKRGIIVTTKTIEGNPEPGQLEE
jgi:hypothetical protein